MAGPLAPAALGVCARTPCALQRRPQCALPHPRCTPHPRSAFALRLHPRCAPTRARGSGGGGGSSIPGGDDAAVAPPLAPAAAAATEQALAAISAADAIAEAPTNLVLIGGRGCGKSSMCRRIAALDSRWQLFPLDTLIQYESDGLSIAEIVANHGWPHFRDVEYETVRKASAMREWALVDAGGGVIVDLVSDGAGGTAEALSARKVIALRHHALVIYVKRDVRYLESRIAKKAAQAAAAQAAAGGGPVVAAHADRNRPALDATSGFAAIMARREPWYQAAAHVVVDGCKADGGPRPKEEITADVLRAFWARASPAGLRGGGKAETRELLSKQAAAVTALAQCLG